MSGVALKPKFSRMLDMQRDFAEIEKFFRALYREELNEQYDAEQGKWVVIQHNLEGVEYDLYGSIEDWCRFFRMLGDKFLPGYDDKPLVKLVSKLRLNQEIFTSQIKAAEAVLKPQRLLFLSVPASDYNNARNQVFETQ
jgi:hypothetical protein